MKFLSEYLKIHPWKEQNLVVLNEILIFYNRYEKDLFDIIASFLDGERRRTAT